MKNTQTKLGQLVQLTNRIGSECGQSINNEWLTLIERMRDGTGDLTQDQIIKRGNEILSIKDITSLVDDDFILRNIFFVHIFEAPGLPKRFDSARYKNNARQKFFDYIKSVKGNSVVYKETNYKVSCGDIMMGSCGYVSSIILGLEKI